MKKILTFILAFVLNTSVFAMTDVPVAYNSADIKVLQKIYNQHIDILNYWDLSDPSNIYEIEWKYENDTYNLISLDLGNSDISGKVDLSEFKNLEYYSFSNTEIEEIILPDGINEIPESAFENCSELEYVNIPEFVNCISDSAFKNCTNLKSIIINSTDIKINSNAFAGCISLNCIMNANSITSIGRNAFSNCSDLIFYDSDISENNPYLLNYIETFGFTYNSEVRGSAMGYIGIMENIADKTINLTEQGRPYKYGTAYLYNENNHLISQSNLNDSGKFFFNELLIGHKYKLVIDGNTAIPLIEYFIIDTNSYIICSQNNAFSLVTCDFNKDGLVTNADAVEVLHNIASGSLTEKEKALYDLNGDGSISAIDAKEVLALANYKSYY